MSEKVGVIGSWWRGISGYPDGSYSVCIVVGHRDGDVKIEHVGNPKAAWCDASFFRQNYMPLDLTKVGDKAR